MFTASRENLLYKYLNKKETDQPEDLHILISIFVVRCIDSTFFQDFVYEPFYEKTGYLHICKNKDADQLRCNRKADQRLCFRYTGSTIPLFPKPEISSL